jgi:hypothetical protein
LPTGNLKINLRSLVVIVISNSGDHAPLALSNTRRGDTFMWWPHAPYQVYQKANAEWQQHYDQLCLPDGAL